MGKLHTLLNRVCMAAIFLKRRGFGVYSRYRDTALAAHEEIN